jgi:mannose-6-phosphate isomerase-like protein (cupin superfamily)
MSCCFGTCSRFVQPDGEDEGIWLDHLEVLVTYSVGQVKEMHVHDPPQDHVIMMRSGRMRWTVDDETLDAEPGDVIVTPARLAHGYEVLGEQPARVVCIDSPKRPKLESYVAPTIVGLGGSLARASKAGPRCSGRCKEQRPPARLLDLRASSPYPCTTQTTTSAERPLRT